jgi:hypothetical protein
MSASDAAQGKVIANPESVAVFYGELGREDYRAVVRERNQARVEGGIEMSRKKQPVVDIKPLGVGFTFGPRLDVTGA